MDQAKLWTPAVAAVAIAALNVPVAASAQVQPQTGNTSSSEDGAAVQEIIVTASKLGGTALSKTAVSAEVVGSEQLTSRQINTPEDLMHATAGVYIDQGSSTPKIAIRGVSFDNFQIQAENGVTTYMDGIVILRTQAQIAAFNDLERVEVLKGPQGSAFGRNSTGGSINYISRGPEAGLHGYVDGGYGSFDRRFVGGALNYGDDVVGIRLSGLLDKDDGYITNLVTGSNDLNSKDTKTARAVVTLHPGDAFSARYFFNIVHSNSGGPGTGYTTLADAAIGAGSIAANGLALANPNAPPTLAVNDRYEVVNSFDPHTIFTAKMHGLNLAYDFGPVKLTSITGFLNFRQNWRSDVAAPSNTVEGLIRVPFFKSGSHQFSQEVLLNRKSDTFSWVLGGYYLRERSTDNTNFAYNLPGCDPLNPPAAPDRCAVSIANGQVLKSYAGFGDVKLTLTDGLRLNAGARYTHDRKTAFGTGQVFTLNSSGGLAFPGVPLAGIAVSGSAVTGQVGLEYDVAADTFAYVKASRGFKGGGINNNDGTTYDPEHINSYEIGLKGKLFDRQVSYAITGFYSDYKGIQLFVNPPGNANFTILNAARGRIYGLDVAGNWQATKALSFDLSGNWMPKANYTKFAAVDMFAGLTDYAGARLSRSPRLSGVIGVNLDVPINDRLRVRGRVEDYHISEVVFSQNALLRPVPNRVSGYDLLGANLTLAYGDHIELRAYGKNLTNHFYITGSVESSGSHFAEFGRPREAGFELRYTW